VPKPHILLVGGDGGRSGVPRYLGQIVRALKGDVRLSMVADENRGGYDFAAAADVPLHQISGLASGLNLAVRWRALRALGAVIRADPPDLVWAHARMAVLLVRARAVLRRDAPVAVTFHGLPFGVGHRRVAAWVSLRIERALCRMMPPHHLLFLSQEAMRLYCREMPDKSLARHHVHVLQNCSDIGPVTPDRSAAGQGLRMVTFGRAGHQKNVAAAAPILARLPQDARLILCGIGTDTPQMRAAFAGLEDRVEFAGEVADVRGPLARADMLLMTSRYEGMPIAALEAFEAGLPLALPVIAGTEEIRARHPLVAQIDVDQPQKAAAMITSVFAQYKTDPAEFRRDIQQTWATHFSYDVWARDLRGLAQTLLDRAGQSQSR